MVALVQLGKGKAECPCIAFLRKLVYYNSTRIAQVVEFGNLVKSLTNAVIDSGSKDFKVVKALNPGNYAVASANKKPNVWVGNVVFKVSSIHVPHHVVNRKEGFVCSPSQSLSKGKSNQQ